jgi:hypothetical protein
MRQVVAAEPVPPGRWQPRVPRDLETVCLKCLHKSPRQRYPSAVALADDLRRFLAGEPVRARPAAAWERAAKWARRRPAAAALAGVSCLTALSLLAGGLWSNARLRAERDRAEASAAETLAVVDEMWAEVAEEQLAYEPRAEQTRRALLEKALRFYQKRLRGERDPALREKAALAQKRVADILRLLGENEQAAGAYGEASALLGRLAAEEPGDPRHRRHLADCRNFLGEVLRALSRPPPPPWRGPPATRSSTSSWGCTSRWATGATSTPATAGRSRATAGTETSTGWNSAFSTNPSGVTTPLGRKKSAACHNPRLAPNKGVKAGSGKRAPRVNGGASRLREPAASFAGFPEDRVMLRSLCQKLTKRRREAAPAEAPARRRSPRPGLEALGGAGLPRAGRGPTRPEMLERREVPAVVASATLFNTSYELFGGGALYEHSGTNASTGWAFVTGGVAKVSVGRTPYSQDAQFVLLTGGFLYEHQGYNYSAGWYYLGSGIRDLSASLLESDCVYAITGANYLYKHLGTSSSLGYNFLDFNVAEVSAGRDPYGYAAAFARYANGNVDEIWGTSYYAYHSYLGSGLSAVSASQIQADTVYMTFTAYGCYEHIGLSSSSGYYYVTSGV